MNIMTNAEQFQAQLHQYVPVFTADYWPVWLILAGLAFVGMLAVLGFHALLRALFAKKQPDDGHEEKVYLYSAAIRTWHWCNAALFLMLLFSGLINHFALTSASAMATLVGLHKACGILFIISWVGFLLVNIFGGNGHHYIVKPQGYTDRAMKQVRFYLFGIIKGEDHPFPATQQSKFNPLQQVAYVAVMFGLVPLLIITGLLALYPQLLAGGLAFLKPWIVIIHFALAIIGLFFVVGHLYLCTTGKTFTQTFKSMFDGYHRH